MNTGNCCSYSYLSSRVYQIATFVSLGGERLNIKLHKIEKKSLNRITYDFRSRNQQIVFSTIRAVFQLSVGKPKLT